MTPHTILEGVISYYKVLVDDGLIRKVLVGVSFAKILVDANPARVLVDIGSIKSTGK